MAGESGEKPLGGRVSFVAIHLSHQGTKFAGGKQAPHLFMMDLDMAAHGEELFSFRHIDTGGDGDLLAGKVEVEASSGGLFEALSRPPDTLMNLVGPLVRAEADVAVDPQQSL